MASHPRHSYSSLICPEIIWTTYLSLTSFPRWKGWMTIVNYKVLLIVQFSSVQLLSRVLLFVTPWTAACQTSLSITNSQSPPRPMSIESVMPSKHPILCHPLLLLSSIFPSIRVFSNESALCIGWPKYWSFTFSISPSNEYSVLISFRMDWLDLLEVQGTLKSLLQYHSSKPSILQYSAFFIVQLSHPHIVISFEATCLKGAFFPHFTDEVTEAQKG